MTFQIHLVRHGRSALTYPNRWITSVEFREWIGMYNRTGIAADTRPSTEVLAMVANVATVVCSDYPR
jgi:hypothetical protein